MTAAPPARTGAPRAAAAVLWGTTAACVALELALQLSDRGMLGPARLRSLAYDYGAFWSPLLRGWQPNYALQPWTMFVSYALLHGGLGHLAVNMVTLWSLGRAVAERAGAAGLAGLLLAGTLGGGLGHGLLSAAPAPMVGASGALFGLAGGLLLWAALDARARGAGLRPVLLAGLGLLALNVGMWWALDGLLAWQAHLGGFVAGAAVAAGQGRG